MPIFYLFLSYVVSVSFLGTISHSFKHLNEMESMRVLCVSASGLREWAKRINRPVDIRVDAQCSVELYHE